MALSITTCTDFIMGGRCCEGMLGLGRRPLIYARSGWCWVRKRYPALFLGDQTPTFEGMRNTMRAGLNLA